MSRYLSNSESYVVSRKDGKLRRANGLPIHYHRRVMDGEIELGDLPTMHITVPIGERGREWAKDLANQYKNSEFIRDGRIMGIEFSPA